MNPIAPLNDVLVTTVDNDVPERLELLELDLMALMDDPIVKHQPLPISPLHIIVCLSPKLGCLLLHHIGLVHFLHLKGVTTLHILLQELFVKQGVEHLFHTVINHTLILQPTWVHVAENLFAILAVEVDAVFDFIFSLQILHISKELILPLTASALAFGHIRPLSDKTQQWLSDTT